MREPIGKQELITVEKSCVLEEVMRLSSLGMRLVQILAVSTEKGTEMTYSFGKDFDLVNVRCEVASGESLASITPVWRGAFLYENEIRDLFGVNIENISVDYKGNFYTVAKKEPFAVRSSEQGGAK